MSDEAVIVLPDGVTQRQIADAIGISISTVSRALAGHPRVSVRTRSDVIRAIDRLNRNMSPAEMGSDQRRVIGLTHSHLVDGPALRSLDVILEQVLGGAETAARGAGYMLYTVQNSHQISDKADDPFFREVQGVIMAGGLVSPVLVDAIRANGIPAVIIGGHLPNSGIPSVGSHNLQGMRSAVSHLIALGHRRIGLVNGPTDTFTSFEKKSGYLAALAEAGIAPDLSLIRWHDGPSGFDVEDAIAMTGELLDLQERPTAIVFASDSMALAGCVACRTRNLAIPADISIVGYHDDPDAQMASPQLTSVRVNRFDWGAAAVRRMLAAIHGAQSTDDRLMLPTQLIVRGSTAAPPAN